MEISKCGVFKGGTLGTLGFTFLFEDPMINDRIVNSFNKEKCLKVEKFKQKSLGEC